MFNFKHNGIRIFAHFDNAVENEFNIIKVCNLNKTVWNLISIECIHAAPKGLGEAEELCESFEGEIAPWEHISWVGGVPKDENDIIKILKNEKVLGEAA